MARCLGIALVALLVVAFGRGARADDKGRPGYAVPSTAKDRAIPLGSREKTVKGVRCVLAGFKTVPEGSRFNTVVVKSTGRTVAFLVWEPDGSNTIYIDSDCDGAFDRRLKGHEAWSIPACALPRR